MNNNAPLVLFVYWLSWCALESDRDEEEVGRARNLLGLEKCSTVMLVKHDDSAGRLCLVARTWSVIGERWTMMILRECFRGERRYDHFPQTARASASDVLDDTPQAAHRRGPSWTAFPYQGTARRAPTSTHHPQGRRSTPSS